MSVNHLNFVYLLYSIAMQNPPVYNPNDPDIYLQYSSNNTTSNTTGSCHICNLCQIEKGSDLRCRCTYRCERHNKDITTVVKNDTTIKK